METCNVSLLLCLGRCIDNPLKERSIVCNNAVLHKVIIAHHRERDAQSMEPIIGLRNAPGPWKVKRSQRVKS